MYEVGINYVGHNMSVPLLLNKSTHSEIFCLHFFQRGQTLNGTNEILS